MKPNISKEEIAWLAGLLEGEACFGYQNPKEKRWPEVRIEMTDKDIIERAQSLTGGTMRMAKKYKPHHKQSWVLDIRRVELVKPVLKSIRPFMSLRRGQVIDRQLSVINLTKSQKYIEEKSAKNIKKLYKTGQYTMDKLALMFNSTKGNVNNIIRGKSWKYI